MHESLSTTLARQIATRDGTDVTTLEPPLYQVIDVDALEQLFVTGDQCGHFSFDYREYTVTVEYGDDVCIAVDERDEPSTHTSDGFGSESPATRGPLSDERP